MPRVHLTQQYIDNSLICPEGKRSIELNDTQVVGMYVSVSAANPGVGTYVQSYKDPGGKRRHVKVGRTNEISLKDARRRALAIKSQVQLGSDPATDLREKKSIPTLKAFLQGQYLPWSEKTKRSYVSDESICRVRVIPELGDIRMDKVTRKQLIDLHLRLLDDGLAPATCNHVVKLIRAAYNKAQEWDVVNKNPAAGLKLLHEDNMVNNYLNEEELARLLHVLKTDANRTVCNICLFLLATGARKSEALNARWEHIDVENRAWRIPASNAKSKKVRSLALNDTALEVINSLRGQGRGEWLFLSTRGERMSCIKKVWERLREKAGLPHLRLHDLRHQAASMLVNSGRSLYEVQTQLGHASPVISQRYAHLSTARMQEAANSIDDVLKRASEKVINTNP